MGISRAYIYYYWSRQPRKVIEDWANPILFSIATLRKYTNCPIYVIDYSQNADWQAFPQILGFNVIKHDMRFHEFAFRNLNFFQRGGLSRNLDIFNLSKELEFEEYIACDGDIFWIRPVSDELSPDTFNYRAGNIGCYHWNKNSVQANTFISLVSDLSIEAAVNTRLQDIIKDKCQIGYFNDEAVFEYVRLSNPHLCSSDHYPYNGPLPDILKSNGIEPFHNIHILHCWMPTDLAQIRGIMGLLIEEFREAILIKLHPVFPKLPITTSISIAELPNFGVEKFLQLLRAFYLSIRSELNLKLEKFL